MSRELTQEEGVLQVPLALAMAILLATCFATWGILRHWRHLTETQLRLDQCVAGSALGLRTRLNEIEAVNTRIRELRLALAVAVLPEAQAPLRAALAVEGAHARLLLRTHDLKRASWVVRRGCGGSGDTAIPLPALPWQETPPDGLGPTPLVWRTGATRELFIQAGHSPRHAAASVFAADTGEKDAIQGWHARWVPPRRPEVLR
jgi:hypothetical protein